MALQKVFLLPPLKGLNLYDNPFTMSPDYAVELVNFMPPTTTFSVRPAMVRVLDLSGQIKGVYSYATGSCSAYGDNWFNSTIKYSGVSELLIKTTATDGVTTFGKVDLSNNTYSPISVVGNASYNDEHAMFKHTMFFVNGEKNSSCYLYNQRYGFAKFVLQVGTDGHENVNNMSNVVIFKDFIFFSTQGSSNAKKYWQHPPTPAPAAIDSKSENALNIFFIATKYADVLDPLNSMFWKNIENLFAPHFASTFSIDGSLQNGGNIIKLCCISKNGSDTIATYLAAITDEGEIVLYDGTDPSDITGQKWQVVGKFQIPPPLSKWAFCDMEGDLIIVTKNGLVSLRRVVFGQTTNVTENLEYKLMSLFKEYMFVIPSFAQFVGLFYHQRNRLLIFNVPTALPLPFNQIVVSYVFNYNTRLIFESPRLLKKTILDELVKFLSTFIILNRINYKLTIEFNGEYDKNNIVMSFVSTMEEDNKGCKTEINLSITVEGNKTDLFELPIVYYCPDINNPSAISNYGNLPEWNKSLEKEDGSGAKILSYLFPKNEKDYRVTNFISQASVFNKDVFSLVLSEVDTFPREISYYNKSTFSETFYRYNTKDTMSVIDFFTNADYRRAGVSPRWSNYSKHAPVVAPVNATFDGITTVCYLLEKPFYDLGHSPTVLDPLTNNHVYTGNGNWTSRTITWNEGSDVYKSYFVVHFDYSMKYHTQGQHDHAYIDEGKLNYALHIYLTKNGNNESVINVDLGSEDVEYEFGYEGSTGKTSLLYGWATRKTNPSVTTTGVPKTYPLSSNSTLTYAAGSEHGKWAFVHDVSSTLSTRIENLMTASFKVNDAAFDDKFKYLFSQIYFGQTPSLLPTSVSPTEVVPADDPTPTTVFNMQDLSILPILNHINIACDFKSTQYVFDSHFGTWSSFEDINMIKGIEHQNDFYFAVPNNITYAKENQDYTYTSSTLYRFEPNATGDEHGNVTLPIRCSYKTVPTFDFGQPNKKIFKRLKIFGTPSVFYQVNKGTFPLLITPFSDFKEGKKSYFIHSFDKDGITQRVLRKHFAMKSFRDLSTMDKEKFWKAYKEENDMITEISMPIIANAGTRFGLQIEMIMNEAYMDIFGFDVYFEPTNQIL